MARLIYGTALESELRKAAEKAERVWLVSGFIKSGFITRIGIHRDCDLQVFSRWRLTDLVSGGSDTEACREALSIGGVFSIHPRLHAKVFVLDDRAFVGSANLTHSGLPSVEGAGNLEAAVELPVSPAMIEFLKSLQSSALQINTELLEEIECEVGAHQNSFSSYNADIMTQMPSAFERRITMLQIKTFTGSDFPWCPSPAELTIGLTSASEVAHDLELFSLKSNPNLADVRSAFRGSRCYAWLVSQTRDDTRFGELTARLHDALDGDPRPYRRDVKRLLGNLLSWAIECDPETFFQTSHSHTRSYKSKR